MSVGFVLSQSEDDGVEHLQLPPEGEADTEASGPIIDALAVLEAIDA
eukprot:CAMPEP_0185759554 /NCGR_PEP_ID=MMETSP1174-20130828/18293_1 /TAXON_ID=35687 /ORGANISM="Dictyocha speculum, Strain CCMP1381" /LENGTH=46 /DNA_ID= /DNA_START= /DNA_END= /DNA_ORIENTATION=